MEHHHNHNHAGHNHSGHHHHHGPSKITTLTKAFVVGIVLNLMYVVIQIVIGLKINSLSLLSDAGHNFLDVAGLALSMLAFKLTKSKASEKYTYGYRKSSILISLLNAVLLLVSVAGIAYEAIFRFSQPQVLPPGNIIAIVAAIGIAINGISAFMFFKDKESDINVKGAFLHLLSDALVSFGIVMGGIIIYFTKIYWIDPLLSIIICIVIISSTWSLLKASLRLSLDGVPDNVSIEKIKIKALQQKNIVDIHHIHIWAISSIQNAMTAHLVLDASISKAEEQMVKNEFRHQMQHFNIDHVTIETEWKPDGCEAKEC